MRKEKALTREQLVAKITKEVEAIYKDVKDRIKQLEEEAKRLNLYLNYTNTTSEISKSLNAKYNVYGGIGVNSAYETRYVVDKIVESILRDGIVLGQRINRSMVFLKNNQIKVTYFEDLGDISRYTGLNLNISKYTVSDDREVKRFQNGNVIYQLEEGVYNALLELSQK